MKSGVFFERDGILNRALLEGQNQVSPRTLEQFQINEDALELLPLLKEAGLVLLATTNQPGLSRGEQSRRELDRMHQALFQRLDLDDILVCPHDDLDQCPCRKPRPGLFLEAAFKWHLDLDRCYVVSDKWQDAQAAHNSGAISLLLRSPWNGSGHRDFLVANLEQAVRKILQLHRPVPPTPRRRIAAVKT
jgi:D-glycero-D-manno-heptose 1,7-bisphosphate phosphatase